ncbi:lipopolysaccharide assembly protein LapA domain-containing protein [Enteractinococcus fodinae]|uniref:Integral membrane protein n=1 Tax=Enteractinococcus fodinae TaxID=684663 RepID=A0ABU2AXH7_9MICC|nr:lipopolysaccharide assembly protein LapA domain-containing protein [Enteractinococcus fodinae]MDR7346052.1 putative integral membrane protein [Enteractinococcus fodinae]
MAQTSDPSENQPQVPATEAQPWPISDSPQEHRPEVRTDPTLDEHQKQGFTGATWIALILGALVLIMLLIFILQNNVPADFAYLGWAFTLPLGVAMLFAAIAGMLIMGLFGSVRLFKLGRRVRKLEKERQTLKRTLE